MPAWARWLIAVIAVIWVLHNPVGAGHDVRGFVDSVVSFGQSVSG